METGEQSITEEKSESERERQTWKDLKKGKGTSSCVSLKGLHDAYVAMKASSSCHVNCM